jgi:hypothetical protein
MTKLSISYDKAALIAYMQENSIEVPVLMTPFKLKLILAEKFLIKAQELSGITQAEFQTYISEINERSYARATYKGDEFIDKCIKGIQDQGVFRLHGYENVKGPFIYLHKVIPQ